MVGRVCCCPDRVVLVGRQGMLFASSDCCKSHVDLVRLYMHEACRVYRDKLVDVNDVEIFDKLVKEMVKKTFEDLNDADIFRLPLMYCHFAQGIGDPKYLPVAVYADLNKLLVDALDNHNEINMAMNLVLFEVSHVITSVSLSCLVLQLNHVALRFIVCYYVRHTTMHSLLECQLLNLEIMESESSCSQRFECLVCEIKLASDYPTDSVWIIEPSL